MHGWKYHYEQAELLMEKATDPNLPMDAAKFYVQQAGVHANLALMEHEEDEQAEEPEKHPVQSLEDQLKAYIHLAKSAPLTTTVNTLNWSQQNTA